MREPCSAMVQVPRGALCTTSVAFALPVIPEASRAVGSMLKSPPTMKLLLHVVRVTPMECRASMLPSLSPTVHCRYVLTMRVSLPPGTFTMAAHILLVGSST